MTGHPGRTTRQRRLVDGGDLRDADTGDDAGGADRPGADPDLDGVRPRIDEGLRAGTGPDVAPDHLDMPRRWVALEPLHHVEQHPHVAVRGVGHEHVDTGLDQGGRALPRISEVADRRTHQQTSVRVLGRVRELLGLDEVLHGDEAAEVTGLVDERQPLTLVLAQQGGRLVARDADRSGDQRARRHHLVHLGGGPLGDGDEAQVSVGDDAEQDVIGVDDGQPRDAVLATDPVEVLEGGIRPDRHRVGDDPRLRALHQVDLVGLVLDREVAVEDAEPALTRHGDRHSRLGDRVHGRRDQRHLQRDLPRETRGGVDVRRRHVGRPRQQEDVVVGQTERGELLGDLRGAGSRDAGVVHRAFRELGPGGTGCRSFILPAPHRGPQTHGGRSASAGLGRLRRLLRLGR